jgi:hypothetical protein
MRLNASLRKNASDGWRGLAGDSSGPGKKSCGGKIFLFVVNRSCRRAVLERLGREIARPVA